MADGMEEEAIIRAELKQVWPIIIEQVVQVHESDYEDIPEAMVWLKQLLERNVPLGKQNRAVGLALFYRHLRPNRTKEEDFDICVLGWVIEILQTASLIADDIIDGSKTRRGQPCWYRVPEVGISAISDAFLLENLAHEIFFKLCAEKSYYHNVSKIFHKTKYQTILGQSTDNRLSIFKNIDQYTEELYSRLVKYKTSFYTFCQPAILAMLMAGITEKGTYVGVESVMLEIGHLFQVQDDYLDCYGDPSVTGKYGTDIVEGKCSWLIVQALKLASPEERLELKQSYGLNNAESEVRVKEIFLRLGLPDVYSHYEDETYLAIMRNIEKLAITIVKQPMQHALDIIYKRTK